MELKGTVKYMISKDYKDRFVAEYLQLKIRYEKLLNMCEKWDKKELNFVPTCPREIYNSQLNSMKCYLECLENRAKLEGIELDNYCSNDVDYVKIVNEALELYKSKALDWWSWDDFKNYLKHKIQTEYSQEIDLRSSKGKEILHYARNKWENDEW